MSNDLAVLNPWDMLVAEQAKGTPIEQLKGLFDLYERWSKIEQEKAWNRAMMNCQRDMPALVKSSHNKHKDIWYAGFEQLDKQIRPVYLRENLSLCFTEVECDKPDVCRMALDVMHVDGFSRRFMKDVHVDGFGAKGNANMTPTQADGSTSSYARRYVAKMAFNLVESSDNDGDGDAGLTGLLNPAEVQILKEMIDEIVMIRGKGFATPKFCSVFAAGASKLEEIPRSEFASAVSELTRWRQESEKGGK